MAAAVNSLAAIEQGLVRAQLGQSFFVERMSAGRINILRFYNPDSSHRIADSAFSDRLFNVRIVTGDTIQVAHVTFYKGYIFSIEFKKPSSFFAGMRIEVADVRPGDARQTYTRGIDRLEHGPNDADPRG
jgi:hypothetical protein